MSLLGLEPNQALVIAPHADDEVLGAGGWICRAAGAGWRVHVLYATIAGYPSSARGDRSTTAQRVAEAEAALAVLGTAGYEVLFQGDGQHLRLDTVPRAELVAGVEARIERLRPSVVLLPCRGHYHQDHRALAEASIAALRPAPEARLPRVAAVLAYGHAAAGWGGDGYRFHPNVFVDVTEVIDRKLAALDCYRSQTCPAPHPRSREGVCAYSAAWGAAAGCAHAEPFEGLRLLV